MPEPIYALMVFSPNPDGIYRIGERVNFYSQAVTAATLVPNGKIKWEIIKNGMQMVAEGEFTTDIIGACASCVADEPCCLECRMTFFPPNGAAPVDAALGAAVEPFKIRPGMAAPDDFDAFWKAQKKRLAAVPAKSHLTPVKADNFDCYEVKIDSVGRIPVSGLLMRSKASYKKKCPVVITLHGAGVKSARPENAFSFVEHDFIVLDINAHGLPNLMPPEFYLDRSNTVLKEYYFRNFDSGDPGEVYFTDVFLRVKRAIEFMASLPEWDGRNLSLFGYSQGGFQSFAGAYLDERVSSLVAGVPAGCDFGGILAGRRSGWPFGKFQWTDEQSRDRTLRAAAYFDNANFASRIKVPGLIFVGLIDGSCSPSSVYAAYNNYAGPKTMLTAPWMRHAVGADMTREATKFIIAGKGVKSAKKT